MSPVAVAADRRFRRARVKPTRRRGRWVQAALTATKIALPLAIVAFVVTRGVAAVTSWPSLRVATVQVEGNRRVTNDQVLAMLNGLVGANILSVDLDEWRTRLEATPWIGEARVRRSFPNTVRVTVSEREPIAVARFKDRLYLIDERGAAIDDYGPGYADLDLPIVDGLTSAAGSERIGDQPRAELAARLIRSLRTKPAVARRLSQIDVTDLHNAAVIVVGDPAVIYVGEDRFLPRLESYFGLAAALRERVPDIDYVDLRFEDRIYVRPSAAGRVKKNVAHGVSGTQTTLLPAASRH